MSEFEESSVLVETAIAKVSISGAGMIGRPGVAAQMFSALADAGVNIQMISTSEVKVSCVVDAAMCEVAIATLQKQFDLTTAPISPTKPTVSDDKPVRGVALDLKQARLAIRHVPDRPGMAAGIFKLLADNTISVDMIIQSQRCRNVNDIMTRDIAFTVAQMDAEVARKVLEGVQGSMGFGEVVVDDSIAKVSIVGSGMIGHPGTAAKMFDALFKEGINIQMIATSEIKVSCLVADADAIKALKAVHEAFELSGKTLTKVPA
jgi:aspartate kinase